MASFGRVMMATKAVQIYTAMMCPFCTRAKKLLTAKGVGFEEIDVTFSPDLRQQMSERSGGASTVPQIFVDDLALGGCDELYALEASGKLDALLAG